MGFIAFFAVPPVPRPTVTGGWSSDACINAKYTSASNNQQTTEILTGEGGMSERTRKRKQLFSSKSQKKCLRLGDNYFPIGCAMPEGAAGGKDRTPGHLTLLFVGVPEMPKSC